MTRHETEDRRIVFAQFFCFLMALIISYVFPENRAAPNFKVADALVMTGTVLLAIKLARDGWEIAAAGFTLLAIAWGGFFIQHDMGGEIGKGILASSFYFFLPSMLMICFYQPFPWWIKLITIISVIPPFIILLSDGPYASSMPHYQWREFNFKFLHFTTFCWGAYFVYGYFKKGANNNSNQS